MHTNQSAASEEGGVAGEREQISSLSAEEAAVSGDAVPPLSAAGRDTSDGCCPLLLLLLHAPAEAPQIRHELSDYLW